MSTHKCAICDTNKAGAVGASAVLTWLGVIREGAKGYAHPACVTKARQERKAKAGKAPAPDHSPKTPKPKTPVLVVPSVAIPLRPVPPLKPLPAFKGWTVSYDALGLIHAKKGKKHYIIPNITRLNDALRAP